MAKEYPLLYGYAGNVEEELHNTNEVADFIMKHGVNSDVTITTPLDTLLLNTYGIYINRITDMEYREELLKVLVPKQQAVFDNIDDEDVPDDLDEDYGEDEQNRRMKL